MRDQLIFETHLNSADVNLEALSPAFRKASLNMVMGSLVCEKVIQQIPLVPKDQVALVLATHFGEVDSSLEFLRIYHETQMPRPILFQNSLHNSTLGFASIQLGLTGPAITVSADKETEAAALLTVDTLLETSPYVLLCFVDYIPELLTFYYLDRFPFMKKYLNKASCFLFHRSIKSSMKSL